MGGASWWVGLAVVQRLKYIDGHRLGPRKVAVIIDSNARERDWKPIQFARAMLATDAGHE